jgi:uncharacterized Rossmann fold enzyme
VFWRSIKKLWSSAFVEVVAAAAAVAVVVEGFLEAVDNPVVMVDVAVVGNNSDAAMEAEATVEVEVIVEAEAAAEATLAVAVVLDEAGVLDGETNAHTKEIGIQGRVSCYLRHGSVCCGMIEFELHSSGPRWRSIYCKTRRKALGVY